MLRATFVARRSAKAKHLALFMRQSAALRGPDSLGKARPAVILTGAGLSTASGIPDYRGPQGLYERGHRPMTYQHFTSGPDAQLRYYARSFCGYPGMCERWVNQGHRAVANLVKTGTASMVITQNVDGLHALPLHAEFENMMTAWDAEVATTAAASVTPQERLRQCGCITTVQQRALEVRREGHASVAELHGNIHRVRCLGCGDVTTRPELQRRLAAANATLLAMPDFESRVREATADEGSMRPDGDYAASAEWIRSFKCVGCDKCGGTLKPDLVFFGESTDQALVQRCFDAVSKASSLVCVGTSLQVFSAYRFVVRAKELGVPIAIVNSGETRGDKDAQVHIDAPAEELLPYVALEFMTQPLQLWGPGAQRRPSA